MTAPSFPPFSFARACVRATLALLLVGCAAAPPPAAAPTSVPGGADGAAPPAAARPLAALAGQPTLLLPVQRVAGDAALGVTGEALDAELAFALEERGLPGWTTAAAVRRVAARNAAYTGDPARLPAWGGPRPRAGDPVRDPLASALRSLAALADARFAVVPEELRVAGGEAGAQARLRLLVVDVRAAQVLWAGETAGVSLADPTAAARATRVAVQFADLIVAPPEP